MFWTSYVTTVGEPEGIRTFATSAGTPQAVGSPGAQSPPLGTPSLSMSGSMQSARPSPSVSGNPSFTTPLQLLSRESQISGDGWGFWAHDSDPPWHVVVPAE